MKGITKQIKHYHNHNGTAVEDAIDEVQTKLKCCGATSKDDWGQYYEHNNTYPDSCCARDTAFEHCTEPFKTPCFVAIENLIESNAGALAGIAVAIGIVQIFGMLFACCLAKSIKKGYEVV